MIGRFRRGFVAVDASLDVFRARPRLAILPLLSLAVVGSAYGAIAVAMLHYGLVTAVFTNNFVKYGAMFAAIAVASGIGVFFNAAVVHCAARHFAGEEPTARDGLAAAWDARGRIAKWSLLSATIGTALYIAEDNVPGVGTLTRSILDLSWGLLTFFVVPVIVTDRTDALRSDLRKSGGAFSRTWGESISATVGIGLVLLPVSVFGLVLLGVAFVSTPNIGAYVVGIAGGALLVATIVVAQVLGMIVRTALYRYAATGERVGPLEDLDPNGVFPED
ncbi:DUF6159 family protein [Natrinema salsiterrestre]|uniref:DUF6159 family protein n=1 Tax=Natrinema salsiterrestre TaxID=2950540 RepID=A0A9Q4L2G5_9EURY|nr:DUF6159 family protein [Natrinema salsiterrestre]MDF9746422.1 DUF6159 family protein [Natrinema salsiterrestre]